MDLGRLGLWALGMFTSGVLAHLAKLEICETAARKGVTGLILMSKPGCLSLRCSDPFL